MIWNASSEYLRKWNWYFLSKLREIGRSLSYFFVVSLEVARKFHSSTQVSVMYISFVVVYFVFILKSRITVTVLDFMIADLLKLNLFWVGDKLLIVNDWKKKTWKKKMFGLWNSRWCCVWIQEYRIRLGLATKIRIFFETFRSWKDF